MDACIFFVWRLKGSSLRNGQLCPMFIYCQLPIPSSVFILSYEPSDLQQVLIGGIKYRFDTQDALYDLAWSEEHENQILVAAGDGSIKLFDVGINEFPVQSWQEHKREAFAVHWNLVSKDTFCSSSWDGTIKVVCSYASLITCLGVPPSFRD